MKVLILVLAFSASVLAQINQREPTPRQQRVYDQKLVQLDSTTYENSLELLLTEDLDASKAQENIALFDSLKVEYDKLNIGQLYDYKNDNQKRIKLLEELNKNLTNHDQFISGAQLMLHVHESDTTLGKSIEEDYFKIYGDIRTYQYENLKNVVESKAQNK